MASLTRRLEAENGRDSSGHYVSQSICGSVERGVRGPATWALSEKGGRLLATARPWSDKRRVKTNRQLASAEPAVSARESISVGSRIHDSPASRAFGCRVRRRPLRACLSTQSQSLRRLTKCDVRHRRGEPGDVFWCSRGWKDLPCKNKCRDKSTCRHCQIDGAGKTHFAPYVHPGVGILFQDISMAFPVHDSQHVGPPSSNWNGPFATTFLQPANEIVRFEERYRRERSRCLRKSSSVRPPTIESLAEEHMDLTICAVGWLSTRSWRSRAQ